MSDHVEARAALSAAFNALLLEAPPEVVTDVRSKTFAVIEAQAAQLAERDAEIARGKRSFEVRWNSDLRAKKRWQDATGRDMEWPDHADLSVWLLARLDASEALLQQAREGIQEACDLLAERVQGSPARSAGHNVRIRLETTLAAIQPGDSHG